MVYGRGANVLINFVLECVALLYELQQRAFHFHFFCARMYFYLCVGVYVDDIEIKVRLSRVSVNHGNKVVYHNVVKPVDKGIYRDTFYVVCLDIGQEFDVLYVYVEHLVVVAARLHVSSDKHGVSFLEIVAPTCPAVAPERYLARRLEVLEAYYAVRFAFAPYAFAHIGYNAAKYKLPSGKGRKVLKVVEVGVADVLEYNAVSVQRVSGKVNAYQFPLFFELFYVAPFRVCGGNVGLWNLEAAHVAEQRVF